MTPCATMDADRVVRSIAARHHELDIIGKTDDPGLSIWEVALWCVTAASAGAIAHFTGQPVVVVALSAISVLAVQMAAGSARECRRLNRRLQAVWVIGQISREG